MIFDNLRDFVAEAMRRLPVPGAAFGVLHDGEAHVAGLGVTNLDHPLPVTPDTLFQIGSITKTFTGTLAMRLIEAGRLDLDAPVRTYLPDLRLADEAAAAGVTLRHLLTHTGGWVGDYFEDCGPGDDALARYVTRMAALPQLTPLGEVWSYNNAGFGLAGRVLEVAAGKTYEAALKELVLDPLGLEMTFIFPADVMTHRFATGHRVDRDLTGDDEAERPYVARPWALARTAHPVGAITSTVGDLLRYAAFHMGDGTTARGERLLSPESLALMQSPLVKGELDDEMGLTWFIKRFDGLKALRHGGATNGQQAVLLLAPERGFAFAMLTNSDHGAELHREAALWALREYLSVGEHEVVQRAMSPEALAAYAGRYTSLLSDVELKVEAGGLVMHVMNKGGFPDRDSPPPPSPPPMRLAFCGRDRVVVLDRPLKDSQGEFLRGPDGGLAWFRFGGRIRAGRSTQRREGAQG